MENYFKAGEKRSLSIGNRGPIKFNKDGSLHKDIMSSYAQMVFIFLKMFMKKKNY